MINNMHRNNSHSTSHIVGAQYIVVLLTNTTHVKLHDRPSLVTSKSTEATQLTISFITRQSLLNESMLLRADMLSEKVCSITPLSMMCESKERPCIWKIILIVLKLS